MQDSLYNARLLAPICIEKDIDCFHHIIIITTLAVYYSKKLYEIQIIYCINKIDT
jgi:hypothetical protein